MNIENYPSNSFKTKEQAANADEKKKLEKVVVGQVKTKKKNGLGKLMSGFVSEETPDIKSYLFKDVVVPTIKKTITEIVDMILYGGSRHKRGGTIGSKVSYRNYWDEPRESRNAPRVTPGYSYDDIILDSRGDAEEVLNQLNDLIDVYKIASVADLYDLVGITGNYTDNKYGWTNLASADVVRTRDGYMLKLPRALPLK